MSVTDVVIIIGCTILLICSMILIIKALSSMCANSTDRCLSFMNLNASQYKELVRKREDLSGEQVRKKPWPKQLVWESWNANS